MTTETIPASFVGKIARLDARYFLSPGVKVAAKLTAAMRGGLTFKSLGGPDGLGKVWSPGRFRRA